MVMDGDGASQHAGVLRLAVLQRPESDGRRIQNYEEATGLAAREPQHPEQLV